MTAEHIQQTGEQLRGLHVAVQSDATIPESHKSILNKIIAFLLNFLPSISGSFDNLAGGVLPDFVEAIPSPVLAAGLSEAHSVVADHPVIDSLAKAVVTAGQSTDAGGRSILDKIFGFIIKILPTVLGLFSHAPSTTARASGTVRGVSGAGAGAGSVSGQEADGSLANP